MKKSFINKRYVDIFEQYIWRGERTPFTIGTLVVCALCFLLLLITTFTQFNLVHPWLKISFSDGIHLYSKEILYSPQIPAMILIIYILGRAYSLVTFIIYLLIGFFIYPIFLFGGGFEYIHNYLFGYFLGYIFTIFITGSFLKINQTIKVRVIGAILGVFTVHLCGFIYGFILAMFKVIDFNLLPAIANAVTGSKISYDLLFSILIIIIAPYIKNVLWVCMKSRTDKKKRTT